MKSRAKKGILMPTAAVRNVTDISMELIRELEIDAILLDVDNTLAPPTSHIPYDGVHEWIAMLKENHIAVVICPQSVLVVGDQIYTDVLGANLAGMKSVLLVPRDEEHGLTIWIRRKMEVNIRKKIKIMGE